MDSKTLEYIRHLSVADRKSLLEKALKVAEEAGELAKVVLPYENAHGTTHRFIDRARILEEVCDTVLTAASIPLQLALPVTGLEQGLAIPAPGHVSLTVLALDVARRTGALIGAVTEKGDVGQRAAETVRAALQVASRLGFAADEVEAMLDRKMLKWADLQSREAGVKYPLPYEIHVTVASDNADVFRQACADLGVKPIILDLHVKDGSVTKDVMTSSVYFGDNPGSLAELRRIADGLRSWGFTVVREKIETVPWHPAAPSAKHTNPVMPKDCYFECHLNIVASEQRRPLLKLIAEGKGAHLSRNVFKRLDGDNFMIMMTYRSYTGAFEDFRASVDEIRALLSAACFSVEKEIVEFSIYDTRVSHDAAWLAAA